MRNTENTVKSQLQRLVQYYQTKKKIKFSEELFSSELLQYLKTYSDAFPASQWNHYDSTQDWIFLMQMLKLMKNGATLSEKQIRKTYVLMQILQHSIDNGTFLDTSLDEKEKLVVAPKSKETKVIGFDDLSEEQQELIERAKNGENVLVDACIGSGKTTAIQVLCNEMSDRNILYLTYNRLLKLDAKGKITVSNTYVQNYHGYAYVGRFFHRLPFVAQRKY